MEVCMYYQDELQEILAYKMKDKDLLFISRAANAHGSGIGITLFTKGTLVTGITVSGKEYYEKQIDSMNAFGDVSTAKLLSEHFKECLELYQSGDNENYAFPDNFLHLKDVSFRLGDGKLGELKKSILRIKIEEVDGYVLGLMSNE